MSLRLSLSVVGKLIGEEGVDGGYDECEVVVVGGEDGKGVELESCGASEHG